MKVFYANKFYFIVSDTKDNDAKELYLYVNRLCDQQNFSNQLKLSTQYLEVNSKSNFNKAISFIEKETRSSTLPYIHIEAHGYKGGKELKSGARKTGKRSWIAFQKSI